VYNGERPALIKARPCGLCRAHPGRWASNVCRVGPITHQENENGTHVECNRAHSDCSTLHQYWGYVGRWIGVHIAVNFSRQGRADIFRLVSYPHRRLSILALVRTPRPGGYTLYLAIYVKPVSRLTPLYMALIDPFRRLIVYPALGRHVQQRWSRTYA
jgi:hypothetical protein